MASLKSKLVPWLRDSAWPRLIFVGFHVAEVGERSVPIACFTATLGYWAFLAPLAMVPGMTVRYLVRRRHVAAGGNGIISAVKATLAISLVSSLEYRTGWDVERPLFVFPDLFVGSNSSSCSIIKVELAILENIMLHQLPRKYYLFKSV